MIAERDLANSETIQVHQKSARVRACLKESRTALEAAVNGRRTGATAAALGQLEESFRAALAPPGGPAGSLGVSHF